MKKNYLLRIAGLFLLGSFSMTFLIGCGDKLPTENDGSVIMPLKVGNMWIGRTTMYNRQGAMIHLEIDTLTVVEAVNERGLTWYKMNNGTLYRNGDEGLYRLDSCLCLDAKYPAAVSDTFNTLPPTPVLLPGEPEPVLQIVASKVFAVQESIEGLGGENFQTHHYAPVIIQPLNARFIEERHSYYVPDLGPVLIEDYAGGKTDGYLMRRWELVKANI